MKKFSSLALVLLMAVSVLLSEAPAVEAVTCSPMEMTSCLTAIVYGTPPSSTCCGKIKEQKPCLCGYIKNPNLRQYVNSPNARKVASNCGVPYPNSC